jgi:hypothetical protein
MANFFEQLMDQSMQLASGQFKMVLPINGFVLGIAGAPWFDDDGVYSCGARQLARGSTQHHARQAETRGNSGEAGTCE